jgi:hypothetical protein
MLFVAIAFEFSSFLLACTCSTEVFYRSIFGVSFRAPTLSLLAGVTRVRYVIPNMSPSMTEPMFYSPIIVTDLLAGISHDSYAVLHCYSLIYTLSLELKVLFLKSWYVC